MTRIRSALWCSVALTLGLAACGQKTDGAAAPQDNKSASAQPTVAPSAPATPDDVVVGTNPPLPSGKPQLDSLGLSLGQSLDGARAAFKTAATSNGLVEYKETLLRLPQPLQGRFVSGLFAQNVQRAGTAYDSLGALFVGPPSSPQGWYVGRTTRYASGQGPSAAALLKSLTDKYGTPQRQAGSEYFWTWNESGAPTGAPLACNLVNLGSQVAGTSTNTAVTQMGDGRPPADCARVLKVQISAFNDQVSEMDIGLTDNLLMWAGLEQTLSSAQNAAPPASGKVPEL